MVRRRTRPSDPLARARRREAERLADRDPGNWGVDRAAMTLPANGEVEARIEANGQRLAVRRRDVFDRLLAGRQDHTALAAVRRLQADLAERHTGGGVARYGPRIDASPMEESYGERRLQAGERTRRALARTGASSARLLLAVIEPDAVLGRRSDWRAVVERETGERLPDAQAGALRAACVNLAKAYADLDRTRRP